MGALGPDPPSTATAGGGPLTDAEDGSPDVQSLPIRWSSVFGAGRKGVSIT
jgi:hypothetical protein